MGNSGRWAYHEKRRTVEECWTMSISDVVRTLYPQTFGPASGTLCPIKPASRKKRASPVRCVLEVGDGTTPLLRLSYEIGDRGLIEHWGQEVVRLQTTKPNFGGVRWWFSCPRLLDGEECGRRVGKLYRPPSSRYFSCRRCLDLTYESCQKSHRHDGLFALMAGEASGEAFEAVKGIFSYQSKEARRLREGPSPDLLDAYDKMFGGTESR